MTNKERIEQLEEKIATLKKEQNDLKKYAEMKENADVVAAQLAIVRDSMKESGFTDDQAFEILKALLPQNNSTSFHF